MIKKIYRLKEREVKKVLKSSKPFFSYNIVLNYKKNKKNNNRFSIIISSKVAKKSVIRNFFRRFFYDFIKKTNYFVKGDVVGFCDFVFIVKKKIRLDHKDENIIKTFEKDLFFLYKKFNNNK